MHAIHIKLLSDTTFSRGDGTAGEVDIEVVHDQFGLPFVPGRTLRGLLRESWLSMAEVFSEDKQAACEILGTESDLTPGGKTLLRIDNAQLPDEYQQWAAYAVLRRNNPVSPRDLLHVLTDIRRQTARDRSTGGSETGSLRASRVIRRDVTFVSQLTGTDLTDDHWRALARMCLGVRHAGTARNRGRGYVQTTLWIDGSEKTQALAKLVGD